MTDSDDKKAIDEVIKGWLPGLAKTLRDGREHSVYCAVLSGLCGGLWHSASMPMSDADLESYLNAQVKLLQRVAARAAQRYADACEAAS